MSKERFKLSIEQIRKIIKDEDLNFETTRDLAIIKEFIGQEKAINAFEFGLDIENPGYNIFVSGYPGTGRKSVVKQYLEKVSEKMKNSDRVFLKDFCYVYNFEEPDKPRLLIFQQGFGKKFKEEIGKILDQIKSSLPKILDKDEFINKREEIDIFFLEKQRVIDKSLEKFAIGIEESGLVLVEMKKDQFVIFMKSLKKKIQGQNIKMESGIKRAGEITEADIMFADSEEFNNLPKENQEMLVKNLKLANKKLRAYTAKYQECQDSANKAVEDLYKEFLDKCMDDIFASILAVYENYPEALQYLKGLKDFVLKNKDDFNGTRKSQNQQMAMMGLGGLSMNGNGKSKYMPFDINVVLDNAGKDSIPIIFEEKHSFFNLFGKIDREVVPGVSMHTNHTMIKAGNFLLADGGYLIIDMADLFTWGGIISWYKLIKTLKEGFLKIEDYVGEYGNAGNALVPQAVPINVKVILIGMPEWYYFLVAQDPDFLSVFKVKVEFSSSLKINPERISDYARFIATCCEKENLLPFDKGAVARVLEFSMRLADSQKKMSTRFKSIKETIVQSDYWARKSGNEIVKAEDVNKALEEKRSRVNLYEERTSELFEDEIYLIKTAGFQIGQVNGLSVYMLGDYEFGKPSRITVRTFAGKGGFISVQRETKQSGPIHDTGLLIIRGYFSGKYGQDKNIQFGASIAFEQMYGGIEGDSASAAELVALISSLAEIPIDQSIAMTGSVNQFGEIQPIGGVNEKIEGWFDTCKSKGLTGKQGVLIPWQNVQHLMLKEEVVKAVEDGLFHIYSVRTIDDALEILLDNAPDDVHNKVNDKLKKFSKINAPDTSR